MSSPSPYYELGGFPPEFVEPGYLTNEEDEDSLPGSPVVEEPTLTPSQLEHVLDIGATMGALGRAAGSGMFASEEIAAASAYQFARRHTNAMCAVVDNCSQDRLTSSGVELESDDHGRQSPSGPRPHQRSRPSFDDTPLQRVSSRAPRIPSMRFPDPLSHLLRVTLTSAMRDPVPPSALQEEVERQASAADGHGPPDIPHGSGTTPLSISIAPVRPLHIRRAVSPSTLPRTISPPAAPSLSERQYYPPSHRGGSQASHFSDVLEENSIELLHPSSARSPSRSSSALSSRGRSLVRHQQRGRSGQARAPTPRSTDRSSDASDDGHGRQSRPQQERPGKVDAGTQVSPPPSPTLTPAFPPPLRPAPPYSPPRARRGHTPGVASSVGGRKHHLPAATASATSLSGSQTQRRPEARVFYAYASQSSPSLPVSRQCGGATNVPTENSSALVGGLKKAGGKLKSGFKGVRRRAKGLGKALVGGLAKRSKTPEFRNPSPKPPHIEVGVLEDTVMTPEQAGERRREIYTHASATMSRLHRLQHEENPDLLPEDCDTCWATRSGQSPATVIGVTLHSDMIATRSGSSLSGMYDDLPPTRPSTRTSNFSFVSDISISSMA